MERVDNYREVKQHQPVTVLNPRLNSTCRQACQRSGCWTVPQRRLQALAAGVNIKKLSVLEIYFDPCESDGHSVQVDVRRGFDVLGLEVLIGRYGEKRGDVSQLVFDVEIVIVYGNKQVPCSPTVLICRG